MHHMVDVREERFLEDKIDVQENSTQRRIIHTHLQNTDVTLDEIIIEF